MESKNPSGSGDDLSELEDQFNRQGLADIGARWHSDEGTIVPILQVYATTDRDIVLSKGEEVSLEWCLDAGAYSWLARMMANFEKGKKKRPEL